MRQHGSGATLSPQLKSLCFNFFMSENAKVAIRKVTQISYIFKSNGFLMAMFKQLK